jgi:hypothetical protein
MAEKEEANEYFKKYTEPVTIVVFGEYYLEWTPGRSRLGTDSGPARDIAIFLDEYIYAYSNGEPQLMVTTEGPSLPASVKSIYTVVWALLSVYDANEVKFIGDAPTLRDMGLDQASNFDSNGNSIIR